MLSYIFRRLVYMIVLLIVITVISFVIIQLPPGDYVTTLAGQLARSGVAVDAAQLDNLRDRYGLDQPIYVQFWKWISNFVQGDFGWSFQFNRPVREVIGQAMMLTIIISLTTLIFTYVVAIPIGIYSATRQYSVGDYVVMFIGFIGLATPNFLLALILMMFLLSIGVNFGGLFSPEFMRADWSPAKVWDLIKHMPLPVVIVGTAGTAGLIRVMRASLLDELGRQYVITARSKGVAEQRLLFKYPVRVAINPIVSTIGWQLPVIVSGTIVTDIVLGLPTTGPLLFSSLTSQDMFLAGTLLLLLNSLTVLGTFISDFLLIAIDPRINFSGRGG